MNQLFPSRLMAALAIAMSTLSVPVMASDDPIATDRPDFVESSNVVGKGRLQVEGSLAVERDKRGGTRQTAWSTPTLVRFGVSENVELRVESDGPVRLRSDTPGSAITTERGYADASLGLKWHAMDARDNLPSMAVLLHADLSSGSAAFREQGTRPSARVVAEWELPDDFSFGIMPGLGYQRENGVFGIVGIVAGKSFTERWRGFVELSSPYIARSGKGGSEAFLTVGSAYLLKRHIQLDAALSRGLNSRTPDLSFTVGLSFKL